MINDISKISEDIVSPMGDTEIGNEELAEDVQSHGFYFFG